MASKDIIKIKHSTNLINTKTKKIKFSSSVYQKSPKSNFVKGELKDSSNHNNHSKDFLFEKMKNSYPVSKTKNEILPFYLILFELLSMCLFEFKSGLIKRHY